MENLVCTEYDWHVRIWLLLTTRQDIRHLHDWLRRHSHLYCPFGLHLPSAELDQRVLGLWLVRIVV